MWKGRTALQQMHEGIHILVDNRRSLAAQGYQHFLKTMHVHWCIVFSLAMWHPLIFWTHFKKKKAASSETWVNVDTTMLYKKAWPIMWQELVTLLSSLHNKVATKMYKCLFIPNCTRKIMWLLINNIYEKISRLLSRRKSCVSRNQGKTAPSIAPSRVCAWFENKRFDWPSVSFSDQWQLRMLGLLPLFAPD